MMALQRNCECFSRVPNGPGFLVRSQDAMNDVLSFHNEKLAGETYNFIHLLTRPLSSSGAHGSGVNGQWMCYDTPFSMR
jgi:hypothetical protein